MKAIALVLVLACAGCAYLHSTTETSLDASNTNAVTVTTSVRAYTLFDSQAALAKLNTRVQPQVSGTSIGALREESSATNVVDLVSAVVSAAVSAALKVK